MKRPTLKDLVGVGFIVLLLNSGYIAAFAHPTIFYMTNVLAHLMLGVAIAVAGAALLVRDADVRRRTTCSAADRRRPACIRSTCDRTGC